MVIRVSAAERAVGGQHQDGEITTRARTNTCPAVQVSTIPATGKQSEFSGPRPREREERFTCYGRTSYTFLFQLRSTKARKGGEMFKRRRRGRRRVGRGE